MKKAIIASLVALASGAAIAVFALRGPDKLVDLRVNAEPQEYSVTFDGESSIEDVGLGYYAICETTEKGNKVGVVGTNPSWGSYLDFHGTHLDELYLVNVDDALKKPGAFEFSHITGFAISFSGGSMNLITDNPQMAIDSVVSGYEYRENEYEEELSITPSDYPVFERREEVSVIIDSLTIWYTC